MTNPDHEYMHTATTTTNGAPAAAKGGDAISKYIELVATQYSLDVKELTDLWEDQNPINYMALKVDTLKEMCRKKGLKLTGTKKDLVARLTNPSADDQKPSKGAKTKKASQKKDEDAGIIRSIIKQTTVNIRRNAFDQYVDPETQYVFNEVSMSVTGHRDPNGTVTPLTAKQMRDCWSRGFSFRLRKPNTMLESLEGDYFVHRYTDAIANENTPSVKVGALGRDYVAFWDDVDVDDAN